jgi:hypothetical protein
MKLSKAQRRRPDRDHQDPVRYVARLVPLDRRRLATTRKRTEGVIVNPLVLPQINLNGSPKERLIEQQCNVMHAASALLKALQEATPNGRDFQFRPAELQPALEAWSQRWVMIDDLRKEIEGFAISIQESDQ